MTVTVEQPNVPKTTRARVAHPAVLPPRVVVTGLRLTF